jgi:adenylate cyclase
LAKQAAALGNDDAETLAWAGFAIRDLDGDQEEATALVDRALTLNPNSALAWLMSASVRIGLGPPELAIAHVERAARLSPLDPLEWYRYLILANAHFAAGRYEEASACAGRALRDASKHAPVLRIKAAICGLLGRIDEGREWVARLLALDPQMTLSRMRILYHKRMQGPRLEAYLDGLRKAGLPE